MGCMSEKQADGTCANCGWVDKGVYLAPYLYPTTYLANRYIVGKLISYNGEGAVYMGYDTAGGIKVIIKEYMPDALCSRGRDVLPLTVNAGSLPLYKTYLSEFIELNRALQSLDTVGLQKVTDVFTENNTAYSVYEFVTGISLKSCLHNFGGTLAWEQAKGLFLPVFGALEAANSAGIVHRGVSPQTLFISEKREVWLLGFAISAARTYGSEINYEVFSGYAAPELYNLSERQGSWTDVYGLSALLYRTLTGITPPDAPERLLGDTLAEPAIVNRDIPANVSATIMCGLELNPDARIKTVGEFTDMLCGTRRVAATPRVGSNSAVKKPSPRKKKREKRDKAKRLAVISTVTVLIVLGLFLIILAATNPDLFKGFTEKEPDESESSSAATSATTTATAAATSGTSSTSATAEDTSSSEEAAEPYTVPNFLGKLCPHADAEEALREANPRVKFVFVREYNEITEKNRIFYQSEEPGETVEDGTEITVRISLGPEPEPEDSESSAEESANDVFE